MRRVAAIVGCVIAIIPRPDAARASNIVVPTAYATTVSTGGVTTPLRSGQRTYQEIIAASQLTAIPSGAPITGIALRINPTVAGGNAFPPAGVTATYSDYTIQLAHASHPPGAMSVTFANNVGAGAVTVRSGPLNFAPLVFPNLPNPPPFGPVMSFTTNYIYDGGDLVITIRHSGNTQGVDGIADALPNSPPAPGYGTAVAAVSATTSNATAGSATFATVVQVTFTGPSPLTVSAASASPASVLSGANTLLTVHVTPGTLPPSTGIQVAADLTSIGGAASQALFDDGSAGGHGDVTAADGIFSFSLSAGSACGDLSLPVTVRDDQLRTASATISLQMATPLTYDADTVPENEPDCGLTPGVDGSGNPIAVDTVDGGCSAANPMFITLPCGRKIAGTAGTAVIGGITFRDTDWYRIDLTQTTRVTWKVRAEFDALFGIIDTHGSANCPANAFRPGASMTVAPCIEGVVTDCLAPGTWFLVVAPAFSPAIPCGRKYQAQYLCGCTCIGDANHDGRLDGADIQPIVSILTSGNTSVGDCSDANFCLDANGDHAITSIDIASIAAGLVAGSACE